MRWIRRITALSVSLAFAASCVLTDCVTHAAGLTAFSNGDFSNIQVVQSDTVYMDFVNELMPLGTYTAVEMPNAPGTAVIPDAKGRVVVDYSNAKDGYIMIKMLQATEATIVTQIKGSNSGTITQYYPRTDGEYDIFPLTDGNGSYQVQVGMRLENSNVSLMLSGVIDVVMTDEFAPFLRPNKMVAYTMDCEAIKAATSLTDGVTDLVEQIKAVYEFAVSYFSYDNEIAQKIKDGVVTTYTVDLDNFIVSRKGICQDYATLMTVMLRSLGIPCKLVWGYEGPSQHAWIDVYTEEAGWISGVVYLDGTGWRSLDPTYASDGGAAYKENWSTYVIRNIY